MICNLSLCGNYWVDYRYNKWDIKIFTKEKAEEYGDNCTDCHECVNCIMCDNCSYCEDCHKCTRCIYCSLCDECYKCRLCNYCKSCKCCIKLNKCKNVTNDRVLECCTYNFERNYDVLKNKIEEEIDK